MRVHPSYHLNKQYVAEDLVTSTYKASGVLQPTGPRIKDRMNPSLYNDKIVLKSTRGMSDDLGTPGRARSFMATRQPRFTPLDAYRRDDPRSRKGDDAYTGRAGHPYHPETGYWSAYDPSELTKEEEKLIAEMAIREGAEAAAAASAGGKAPAVGAQPLFAHAAKMGLSDPNDVVLRGYEEPPPPRDLAPPSFHDTDDHFRKGVLIHQPSRPNSSFASGMAQRSAKPKPLEPYHRERYGSELGAPPLNGFITRPYAGVGTG